MRLHHIAFAIKEKNLSKYIDIFTKRGGMIFDEGMCEEFNTYCMFITTGNCMIELIFDGKKGKLIRKYLRKHKEGSVHHIAYESKFKGGVEGALEGMRIKFNDLKLNGGILIEDVDFDE